jgi:hypothetical protein
VKKGIHVREGYALCGIHKNVYDRGERLSIVDLDKKESRIQLKVESDESRWAVSSWNDSLEEVLPSNAKEWLKAEPDKAKVLRELISKLEQQREARWSSLESLDADIEKHKKLLEEMPGEQVK